MNQSSQLFSFLWYKNRKIKPELLSLDAGIILLILKKFKGEHYDTNFSLRRKSR